MPILTTSVMRSPAKPRHFPPCMLSQKLLQALEDGAHLGRRLLAGAQRHVADGAAFGVVDQFAGHHLPLPALEVGGAGQRVQQRQRFAVDPLLGKIEQQPVLAQRKTFEALPVGGEQFTQMRRAHGFRMGGEGAPGRGVDDSHSHIIRPVSNLWIRSGCDGKMRIRYSSLPQLSGVRSMAYSISPVSFSPRVLNG
jgi:hypothetical protein